MKEKQKKPRKQGGMAGKVVKTVFSAALCIVLAVLMVAVNTVLPTYARMVNSIAGGFDRKVDNSHVDTTGLDLQYNKGDYTAETIQAAEEDLKMRIANEGVVLLKNDGNALPVSTDTTFSFFSVNSATVKAGRTDRGRCGSQNHVCQWGRRL